MVTVELSWPGAAVAAASLAGAAAGAKLTRRPRLVAASAFARESAVVLALFALWQLAGSFATAGPDGALARARWLWHLERVIHLPSETIVQRAFLPHPMVVQAMNLYYAGLHFPVLIVCLLWLFIWHRQQYRHVRTTLVMLTATCLFVQFLPVAPPRMLTGDGMVDTAAQYGQSVYGSVAGFNADQLSAMPSVHVAWALLVALVAVQVSRSHWRWFALAYPAGTLLAVTVTANHFWLDGIVAALLLVLVLLVQRAGRAARAGLMAGRRASAAEPAEPGPSYVPDRPPVDA
jgi:hypothetical protein